MFSVSSGDIDTNEVYYRHVQIDSTLKSRVTGDYSTNYPREPAFDPANLIVVTWKLGSDLDSSAGVVMVSILFSYSIISCTVMKMIVSFLTG